MDENRRSGNNGDISAAYGDDTAELLNEKKAEELLAGPAMLSAGSSRLKAGKSAATGSDTSGGKPRGRRRSGSEKSAVELNADKPEVKKSAPKRSSSAKAAATDADGGVKAKSGSGKSARKKPNSEKSSVESADEKSAANKKRASKKTAVETAVKASSDRESAVVDELDQAGEDRAGHGSCKTPQVMKLIENDNDNLVLFAGKSRVPNLLRGRESLSRITRRSAAEDETEVVNITELVINHEAVEILDRFNACSCEKCVKIFSGIIAQRIPVRYARISRSELESGELPERAASMRKVVLPEMIRELICNKKRCFHEK